MVLTRGLRPVLAVLRRDLRTAARYPLGMANFMLLSPFYQLILPSLLLGSAFLVQGRSVGLVAMVGTSDLAGFLFTGALIQSLILGTCWGVNLTLSMDRELGTLEHNFLAPLGRDTFVAGSALASLAIATVAGVLLLVLGQVLFGARYLSAAVFALPALLLAVVALVGLAHLVAAAILLLRQADLIVDGVSFALTVLSGVLFPVTVLPAWLRPLALALPTTHALDVLRHQALGTAPLMAPPLTYALASGGAVTLVVLGRWTFRMAERRLQTAGTLGQH
jgi:ABC-type multidrug transport system permease subunit